MYMSDFKEINKKILLNLSALGLCLHINDSGLFAWINLAALSVTYFNILVAATFTFVMEPIVLLTCSSISGLILFVFVP